MAARYFAAVCEILVPPPQPLIKKFKKKREEYTAKGFVIIPLGAIFGPAISLFFLQVDPELEHKMAVLLCLVQTSVLSVGTR